MSKCYGWCSNANSNQELLSNVWYDRTSLLSTHAYSGLYSWCLDALVNFPVITDTDAVLMDHKRKRSGIKMGFYLSGKDAIQRIREREKQIEAKVAARGSGRGRKCGISRKCDSGGPVSTTDAVRNFRVFKMWRDPGELRRMSRGSVLINKRVGCHLILGGPEEVALPCGRGSKAFSCEVILGQVLGLIFCAMM